MVAFSLIISTLTFKADAIFKKIVKRLKSIVIYSIQLNSTIWTTAGTTDKTINKIIDGVKTRTIGGTINKNINKALAKAISY